MSLVKRVAVSVDLTPAAEGRVTWAASLASAFGAELAGLAAAEPYLPAYSPFATELLSLQPEIVAAAKLQVTRLLASAGEVFQRAAGQTETSWKAAEDIAATEHLCAEGRAYDALVLGRSCGGTEFDAYLGASVEEVVLGLGRPMFIVPPDAKAFSAARVVMAWKDGREARRALGDALPFLQAGSRVYVCAIGEGDAAKTQAAAVAAYLRAHGHSAEAIVEPGGGKSDSEALLGLAARLDATLLVAGAYGRSRFKEWVFGGVTRDLLDRTPLPCLLSH